MPSGLSNAVRLASGSGNGATVPSALRSISLKVGRFRGCMVKTSRPSAVTAGSPGFSVRLATCSTACPWGGSTRGTQPPAR